MHGRYDEASPDGRFTCNVGTVVAHPRFHTHVNRFSSQGARVLNLPLPAAFEPSLTYRVAETPDVGAIVRLARVDPPARRPRRPGRADPRGRPARTSGVDPQTRRRLAIGCRRRPASAGARHRSLRGHKRRARQPRVPRLVRRATGALPARASRASGPLPARTGMVSRPRRGDGRLFRSSPFDPRGEESDGRHPRPPHSRLARHGSTPLTRGNRVIKTVQASSTHVRLRITATCDRYDER